MSEPIDRQTKGNEVVAWQPTFRQGADDYDPEIITLTEQLERNVEAVERGEKPIQLASSQARL